MSRFSDSIIDEMILNPKKTSYAIDIHDKYIVGLKFALKVMQCSLVESDKPLIIIHRLYKDRLLCIRTGGGRYNLHGAVTKIANCIMDGAFCIFCLPGRLN